MASTKLTDLNFDQSLFGQTLDAVFTTRTPMIGGLMRQATDAEIPANAEGFFYNVPRFAHISGDSVQITDSTSTTINSVPDWAETAVWVEREIGFGADQVAMHIAGKDPVLAVYNMVANYMLKEIQRIGFKILTGLYTTALATHSYVAGAGSTINENTIIGAKRLIGDNMDMIREAVLHSKVMGDAVILKMGTYDTGGSDTFTTGQLGNLLGMRTGVTDEVPETGGVYDNYIGAPGSIIFKLRNRKKSALTNGKLVDANGVELELNREAKTGGGQDELIARFSLAVHVWGAKWNVTTSNPTDAQLATDTNWAKAATDGKYIKLIQMKTL